MTCAAVVLPTDDLTSEQALLQAARAGEAWALERFYDRYQPLVFALCYRILGAEYDAEDAAQAAFTRAFAALPRFRGDASLKTWIYRIGVREAINVLRRRKSGPEPLPEQLGAPPQELCDAGRIAVRQTIQKLPAQHRTILVLRYWEELSYEEIAQVLGLSLPTVKMRLHRARHAFAERYDR